MTRDVLVSVKGTQLLGEEGDTIEIITTGTYYEKNGRHYILYDEAIEDIGDVTNNIVKISEDKVEVIKRGIVDSCLTFEKGKKHKANYVTPIGLIMLGITTSVLDFKREEDAIYLHMDYSLEMNGEYVSNCRTDIKACSKKDGAFSLS